MLRKTNALSVEDRSIVLAIRDKVILSALVCVLFFGVFGAWSAYTPIVSAALAPGQISPEGYRRTVQHLEGGIISAINVRDGDVVQKGDVLATLEAIQAGADHDALENRLNTLYAVAERISAEKSDALQPDWRALRDKNVSQEVIAFQEEIFHSRRENHDIQINLLGNERKKLQSIIVLSLSESNIIKNKLSFIEQEISVIESLVQRGLAKRSRALELQRLRTDTEALLAQKLAEIEQAEQAIQRTDLQESRLAAQRREEISSTLAATLAEIAELESEIGAAGDVLARTTITAPVSGTVIDLKLQTAGAVIGPGDEILDIVPNTDELLIDARVSPKDIEALAEGLPASVRLASYSRRHQTPLKGVVRSLSADTIADATGQNHFYLARIEIAGSLISNSALSTEIVPGMPAEVAIITGEKTLLSYLIEPIIDVIDRGFVN